MNNFRVFYNPATGKVNGWEFSNTPTTREGQDYIDLEEPFEGLSHMKHKVVDGAVVEMTDEEKYAAQLPSEHEVKVTIFQELNATDSMFAPGRLTNEQSDAWTEYRQKLRDLSKQGLSHIEQINAWPDRPDGIDMAMALKDRVRKK
jgi:hypothetical protein